MDEAIKRLGSLGRAMSEPIPSATATKVASGGQGRRTFAVISHPDAGKSTLTEAFALHARVITEAGAIHGKSGRRDGLGLDGDGAGQGISITSTAFAVPLYLARRQWTRDQPARHPRHADFSEDTYRVRARR